MDLAVCLYPEPKAASRGGEEEDLAKRSGPNGTAASHHCCFCIILGLQFASFSSRATYLENGSLGV